MTRPSTPSSRAATRRASRRAPVRNPWPSRIAVLIGAAAVLLVVGAIVAASLNPPADEPGAPAFGEITCDRGEHFTYHVHAHLAIRDDGAPVEVPGGIGIVPGRCIYWLHTHQADGILHVEAPRAGDFSLGQFFDIWGQQLTAGQVGPVQVPEGDEIFVWVDGQRFEGDPRTIVLADHRLIELQVGTEAIEPQPYSFPPGL
jgi:hypothetical protein